MFARHEGHAEKRLAWPSGAARDEKLRGHDRKAGESSFGSLSSDAKCTPPADLVSAWLFRSNGSVAMRSYSHLSEEERDQIGVLRAAGRSIGAIAKALGRPKCTVSRELFRNSLASGRYSRLHAACAACGLRRREAALERDERLRGFVRDRLAEGWSPEQISGCTAVVTPTMITSESLSLLEGWVKLRDGAGGAAKIPS